jgi:chromosome segregation ATPase
MRSSDMARRLVLSLGLLATWPFCPTTAHAQSEADRLREALRGAIAQVRALEDQQAVLQARMTEAERERERSKQEVAAARAQIKAGEKAQAEAVGEFNRRLDERNEALEKWKLAYGEAAGVARAKDAERAKFEADSKSFKASAKSCASRNIKLVAIGNELLSRLDEVHLGDMIAAREPLIGTKRVEIQNLLQDYQDKILEQRANP